MNKSFILLDSNNNLQKNANVVVKFNYEGKDYLVYSVSENEQNSQIFASKLIVNSEGKYFIDNILDDEKAKLSNIVYNIVILVPTESQKGISYDELSKDYFDKFNITLSIDIPELTLQNYYSNCSIAITNKILVENAIQFYNKNLVNDEGEGSILIPTWTAPVAVTAPVEASVDINASPVNVAPTVSIPAVEPVVNTNLQSTPVPEVVVPSAPVVSSDIVPPVNEPVLSNTPVTDIQVNPQVEKLAIVSDPSLGIGVSQPNVGKIKKAGFANTKYLVIGTICLLLAVAVVVAAYFLITNMQ